MLQGLGCVGQCHRRSQGSEGFSGTVSFWESKCRTKGGLVKRILQGDLAENVSLEPLNRDFGTEIRFRGTRQTKCSAGF